MLYRILFLVVVGLLVSSLVYADVPKLINFQGRLTDVSGKFVPDGVCTLTVSIYTDADVGIPKWSEIHNPVNVSKGLFNVILGETNTIPDSIFTYANLWLGIKVNGDPEMIPRQRLTSVGYAYRSSKTDTSYYSINSDKLDGLHASDFTSPVSDYGRFGVATDLYEVTSTLTSKYVNTVGPDSVYSTSATAFKARVSGNTLDQIMGIRGYAFNSDSGDAFGGYFIAGPSGPGKCQGVAGEGYGSTSKKVIGFVRSC